MPHHHPLHSTPIAIIGMAGRYPGGANSTQELWCNLVSGKDGISKAKGDRWDAGFHNANPEANNRFYAFEAGFLDQIDQFDAEFFGISPREARQVDPQQRLLLELAWEALEDAHVPPRQLSGTRTGVFIGLSNHDYAELTGPQSPDAYTNTGMSMAIASNRISYVLDLKGPSMTVDTACSSGMVGVHMACQSLAQGESDVALAGACNMLIGALPWLGFAQASMLSPESRCKSFDASGAGYVRAEGGGMLVLKTLAAAERDGDQILGVILATGVNSDGKTMGLSMPSTEAQAALLNEVYAKANITPDDLFYVEAHGTGTAVGDPIECKAIGEVLGQARLRPEPLYIGSIKSNIGHLEPAAGIAGLTKVLLALRHRTVPANLHFKTPNPKIDFEGWKLKVVAEHLELPTSDKPLIFGINSFGFGGTNAHAVVQEYRPTGSAAPAAALTGQPAEMAQVLMLSAQTAEALQQQTQAWAARLQDAPEAEFPTLRAAAAHHRQALPQRLALQASSAAQARAGLQAFLSQQRGGWEQGRASASGQAKVAWVFSGNGPQWQGMGGQLLQSSPLFAQTVREVDALFAPQAGWSIEAALKAPEAESRMHLTEVAQPTLFALQVGVMAVLRNAGQSAQLVFGHSVGEVAAAYASGALSLAQATQVIHQRSLAQSKTAGLGKMAAIALSADEAQAVMAEVLAGQPGFLELAAVNAPKAVTVAGDPALLERLCERVTSMGKFARLLTLNYAFHTSAMDGIREDLAHALADLQPSAAHTPFLSSVEGKALDGAQLSADYWWRNVREPVAFAQVVAQALNQGITHFIEIGPHPVLKDYVAQCAKARSVSVSAIGTLRRPGSAAPEDDLASLWSVVLQSHTQGLMSLRELLPAPQQHLDLPSYPWQRSSHWRGWNHLPDVVAPFLREHPLLGWRAGSLHHHWESVIDPDHQAWLKDHQVQDAAVFPAAGYIEMALGAAQRLLGADATYDIEDLQVQKPLVLQDVQTVLTNLEPMDGCFDISSHPAHPSIYHPSPTTLHVRGRLTRAAAPTPTAVDMAELQAQHTEVIDAEAHYAESRRRGLNYGPNFQAVRQVGLSAPEAAPSLLAEIVAPTSIAQALHDQAQPQAQLGDNAELANALATRLAWRAHPVLLDACLQSVITLMSRLVPEPLAFIPVQVDHIRSHAPLPERFFCHVSLRSNLQRSGMADLTLLDDSGRVLLEMQGARFQKVEFHHPTRVMPRLIEHWRPAGLPAVALPLNLPPLSDWLPAAPAATHTEEQAQQALARLSALHARAALNSLNQGPWHALEPERLQRRLRLPDAALTLLEQALSAARSLPEGEAADSEAALDAQWRQAWRQHGASHREWIWLTQWLSSFGERLTSESPVLSHDGLLDAAPWIGPVQQQSCATLQALCAHWPQGRPLRVLELAGHQGTMSARSLEALRGPDLDYQFTDADKAAVDGVAQRLSERRQLRTPVLDLRHDGLPSQSLDLILCHQAVGSPLADPQCLQRAHEALVPGGLLVWVAALPQAWLHLLGEAGADLDVWQARAQEAGFAQVKALAPADKAQGLVLMVAQRAPQQAASAALPSAPSTATTQRWLLLADVAERPLANALAHALHAQNQQASIHIASEALTPEILGTGELQVVHLAGLTAAAPEADAQLQQAHRRCAVLLALSHALEAQAETLSAKLHVVTHRAFTAPGGQGPLDPSQIAVWGMARVLANEHSRYAPKLVDLHVAPADQALSLAQELLQDDKESEILLSPHGRYVNRMEPAAATDYQALPVSQVAGFRLVAPTHGGGLDALQLQAMNLAAPAADHVQIAVRAAGLNYRDVLWAMGILPEEAVEHGFAGATVGMECAGVVTAVGAGVHDLQVGDRVMAFATDCFASHVNTARKAVVRLPSAMSFEEAATVPTTFITAHYALNHLAHLDAGESILIHGAAGGVGLAAVQMALNAGAEVFATAGSEDKRRLLKRLGVHHVLDSRSLAFAEDVNRLTGGAGVDVVLNSLAGEAITKNLQLLKPFGRMLEIGKRDLYANNRIGLRPFRNNLSYFGIDADTLLIERPALAVRLFKELMAAFEDGSLHALPHQCMPLTQAVSAFRRMQQSRHVGKIVLTIPSVAEVSPHLFQPTLRLRADATYLVSGGLGGFGLATARWMVAQGARHMVLLSRRGASTEEAQQGIAAMQAMGATVKALAVDVTDAQALAPVLEAIRQDGPPLRGALHAAMVLDDAPISKLTEDRILQVMRPKILGAWHLHTLTQHDPLDHFVMYSSGTTAMGNPGQGNYVAANLYLESLALLRRSQGLPALSVGWGGILDVGVLTRSGDLHSQLQARAGISSVTSEAALIELGQLMALGVDRACVAPFNVQRMAQLMPLARTPRFLPLAPEGMADALGQQGLTLADRLAELAPETHKGAVVDMLCQHLGRILGTGAAQIDPTKALSDMGLDSLMAVELADGLEREMGRPVSVMQMLQAGNAQAIADLLLGMLAQGRSPAADASVAAKP
ncbi:SDR family NAD(P)-dependent oxidoreductase [Ideonella sp.]|uniref:SDR family NAD(P)-dependent oxidoreductase n=1 Tax=Ideonella sp. TaxID=1929293 RepID=UPI0037C07497